MFGLFSKPEARFWDALLADEVNRVREMLQADAKLAAARAPQKLCRQDAWLNDHAAPLHAAAARGYAQILKLLLVTDEHVDPVDATGSTPLHLAAEAGHREVVELLLYRHAELDARDHQRRTPLHRAGAAGHDDVVELLLDRGAGMDTVDEAGHTVLHSLAMGGCEAGVRRLLEADVEVDECDKHKQRTPLHLAVVHADHSVLSRVQPDRRSTRARMERVAHLLIEHGADANALDVDGNTPLDLFNALQGDDESDPLVKLLRKHGGRWLRYHHRHADAADAPAAAPAVHAAASAGGRPRRGRQPAEPAMAQRDSHGSTVGPSLVSRGTQEHVGAPIPLGEGVFLLGRNPECDVRYLSRTMSRRHAEIRFEHGVYMIRDLGSRNGVQINDRHLHAPHLLSPGEIITIGVYQFEFDGQNIIPLSEEISEAELRAELSR
ncbi:MAG: ankyrin repeat domain-containing protein [Phycisphaeraceae bacterium]